MDLFLRPANPEDESFFFKVYASTRAEEMAIVPWNDEQKQQFVRMQFKAQTESYQREFPAAKYDVIVRNGAPAGRLIVNRSELGILIIDIALLPEHRNFGIGSALIAELKEEARKASRPLQLSVENFNPALRLYEQLGFEKVSEVGFYYRMEWRPGSTAGADI